MFRFLPQRLRLLPRDPLTRKRLLIRLGWVAVILIIVTAAGVAALRYRADGNFDVGDIAAETAEPTITTTTEPIPTVASPLDGRQVTAEVAARRPLAIMIENHPEARPQFGLSLASVVYEAVTEGGITRFLAIFGTHDGAKIGPVRSARPYFLGWVLEMDAGYGHVGGSALALAKIKELHVKDLDQFALGNTAYRREPKKGVATEHTVFTDTAKLRAAAFDKFGSEVTRPSLSFKTPLAREHRATSQQIAITFSLASYNTTWTFDPETNRYLRSQAGSLHKDAATGETIAADTLIVQEVKRLSVDAMQTVGSGKAQVFMDGQRYEAAWSKTSHAAETVFTGADGAELARNPGLTWIAIVDPSMSVVVQ